MTVKLKNMKSLYSLLVVLFFTSIVHAQEDKIKKIVPVGNLFEVTIFYENGNVMQHGFLTKEDKLHASWESYNEDGTRQCVATYNNGDKVGVWFYYKGDKKTKVVYDDNKIISVEELLPEKEIIRDQK
jgi:antitoxin component YwqK of YwqJK toxin-antitoxin module